MQGAQTAKKLTEGIRLHIIHRVSSYPYHKAFGNRDSMELNFVGFYIMWGFTVYTEWPWLFKAFYRLARVGEENMTVYFMRITVRPLKGVEQPWLTWFWSRMTSAAPSQCHFSLTTRKMDVHSKPHGSLKKGTVREVPRITCKFMVPSERREPTLGILCGGRSVYIW